LPLEGSVPGDPIGRVMLRADAAAGSCARDTNDAKVIFKAEARLPTGYTILTSYPILTHRPADIDETCTCLFQLIGGYFHQDWYDEFGRSPQAALEAYVAASTRRNWGRRQPKSTYFWPRTVMTRWRRFSSDSTTIIFTKRTPDGPPAWLEKIRTHLRTR